MGKSYLGFETLGNVRDLGQRVNFNTDIGLNIPGKLWGQILNSPYNQDKDVSSISTWGRTYYPWWGYPNTRDVRTEWGTVGRMKGESANYLQYESEKYNF